MPEPETTVVYRWPDESSDSKVRVDGSSAQVSAEAISKPGTCPGTLYLVGIQVSHQYRWPGDCVAQTQTYYRYLTGPIGTAFDTKEGRTWWISGVYYQTDQSPPSIDWLYEQCHHTQPAPGAKIVSIEPAGPENNCPKNACKFTVKDASGAVVFSETKDGACPTWHVEGGCPPDTLDCNGCCFDCGAYIADIKSLIAQVQKFTGSPVTHK